MGKFFKNYFKGYPLNGTYADGEDPGKFEEGKMGTSLIFRLSTGAKMSEVLSQIQMIDLLHIESRPIGDQGKVCEPHVAFLFLVTLFFSLEISNKKEWSKSFEK